MAETVVETSAGKVRGNIAANGVHAFKGIPYGGPTSGQNRFMPPAPPQPWAGVRDATHYGQACFQPFSMARTGVLGISGVDAMGEDCLVLNVWARGVNGHGKRPVMVWLHGGGFVSGSGDHLAMYDGANLARRGDVVVVSVNHRLGVLGYLHLGELAGKRYASSGNAGMLDLVAALDWVRDNIAGFGGDPGNVTIFGESGGGAKVSCLLAMPAASGLFHRAVVQSGPGLMGLSLETATRNARDLLTELGLSPERIDDLHRLRGDAIFSAQLALAQRQGSRIAGGNNFSPVVDGKALPAHPFHPVAAPTAAGVPLMIGTTKDEMTLLLLADPQFGKYDEAAMRTRAREMLALRLSDEVRAEQVDALIDGYRQRRPEASPHELLIAITTDRMRVGSIRLAERKAAGAAAPVYMYLFAWESPALRGTLKACHTVEIPFVFDNVDPSFRLVGESPERLSLAARTSGAWIAFARGGNPNHEGLPHWPAYTADTRATMILDTDCRIVHDPGADDRQAWVGII